jgi:hypothetical protein
VSSRARSLVRPYLPALLVVPALVALAGCGPSQAEAASEPRGAVSSSTAASTSH